MKIWARVGSLLASQGRSERRNHTFQSLLDRQDAMTACRVATACGFRVARLHRLAALAVLLAAASSADAADPYPVPAGARSVALAYRSQWIEAAKRNPVFYNVDAGMDVDKVEVLDGYANVMLIGPDVVRFAKSGEIDPAQFATRILFEFPMMVEGTYVGNVVIGPRSATDGGTAGEYVFRGGTDPGGGLDKVVGRRGGYSRASTFSVVSFIGESFSGVFLRLAVDDVIQFLPVNPEAETLFSAGGDSISLPADRAVLLIRARVLERAGE